MIGIGNINRPPVAEAAKNAAQNPPQDFLQTALESAPEPKVTSSAPDLTIPAGLLSPPQKGKSGFLNTLGKTLKVVAKEAGPVKSLFNNTKGFVGNTIEAARQALPLLGGDNLPPPPVQCPIDPNTDLALQATLQKAKEAEGATGALMKSDSSTLTAVVADNSAGENRPKP